MKEIESETLGVYMVSNISFGLMGFPLSMVIGRWAWLIFAASILSLPLYVLLRDITEGVKRGLSGYRRAEHSELSLASRVVSQVLKQLFYPLRLRSLKQKIWKHLPKYDGQTGRSLEWKFKLKIVGVEYDAQTGRASGGRIVIAVKEKDDLFFDWATKRTYNLRGYSHLLQERERHNIHQMPEIRHD